MEIHLSDSDLFTTHTDIDKISFLSFSNLLMDVFPIVDKITYTGVLGVKILKNRWGAKGVIIKHLKKNSIQNYL